MIEVKIFVSSPGDVGPEREIAQQVLERVQGEFAPHVRLLPYFWEHEPMLANAGDYQENIAAPGDFDIFVCLLWSRLGTRLHSRHRTKDGRVFESGTVFEFQNALETARASRTPQRPHGSPDMLVFIKRAPFDPPHAPPLTRAERDERIRQFDVLQDFIHDAFRDQAEDAFNIAANSFDDLPSFERILEKGLRQCILARLPDGVAIETAPPATWTRGSPYFGLRAFELEDAPVFFGRTTAIDAVLNRLRTNATAGTAFCLLFGSSGVGKSSLARAGVLPFLLRPGVIEGIALWRYALFQPRDGAPQGEGAEQRRGDLFRALTDALLRKSALPELTADGTDSEKLAAMLRGEPGSIAALLKGGLSQAATECMREKQLERQPPARLALLVDQLEELFTQDWITETERAAFVHALAILARSGLVFVVATLRADFFSRCESLPELMALKDEHGHYHVEPPKDFELGQMIRLPALAAGLRFERNAATGESLDERLRADALRSPEALPLLAFALERVWLKRDRERHVITFAAYEELGGLEGALRTQADAMFDEWARANATSAAAAFDAVMRRIVTIQDRSHAGDAHYARAWVEKSAFVPASAEADLVERGIVARLFVADEPSPHRAIFTLAHEALFRIWPRLATWLEENRAFFRQLARLQARMAEWLTNEKRDDFLLPSGLPFESARVLAANHRRDLSPEQLDYIRRSGGRIHAAARRKRILIAAAFVALAALAAVAVWQAARAQRQRVAAEAARGDADNLNLFLLGDLREQLEETGRLDLLDSAAQRTEAYLARLATQPANDARRTQQLLLAHNLGRLRLAQGRLGEARETLRTAEAESAHLVTREAPIVIARARVLNALCDLLARTGENAEGQRYGRDALALLNPLADSQAVELRSDVLINLADLQKQAHQYQEAASSIAQSLQLIEPLAAPAAARTARRIRLRALLRAGDLAAAQGDAPAAQTAFEQRLAIAQAYSAAEPLAPLWKVERAFSYDRLAQFWFARYQLDKAAAAADAALGLWRELLAHDPENLEWLRLQATAQTKRGQTFLANGQAAEARDLFQAAVGLGEKLTTTAPRNLDWLAGLANARSLLSDALAESGDAAGALREANAALEIRRRLHDDPVGRVDVENTRNLALSLAKTAVASMNDGAYQSAEKLAEKSVALARELGGSVDALPDQRTLLASSLETYGETLVGQEHQPEGLALYREALTLRLALVRDFPREIDFRRGLAACHESIGGLLKDRGEKEASRAEYQAALTLRRALAQELKGNKADAAALAACEQQIRALDSPTMP
jgi:eukaryotic-like serine/threonine-protein kinase